MDLNKEYLVKDYPLEGLEQGTIIKGLKYKHSFLTNNDIIIMSESSGVWNNQNIIGFCVTTGEFYTVTHNLEVYEILKLPNK